MPLQEGILTGVQNASSALSGAFSEFSGFSQMLLS